jgi:glycosyltransferase involved in cell wall biosynthesis
MKENPELSIIIPAYNEEKAIKGVIADLKQIEGNYEIIVVDDGSIDKTFEFAQNIGIQVIKHSRNKGYGAALKTGIRNANADIILFFDADGQHNHEDIQKIIREIGNYDMVVGARTKRSHRSYLREPGKKVLGIMANYLAETKIPDLNSGLRAVKKDVINRFMHILPNTFSFTTTLTLALLKGGYEVHYIPISTFKRIGRSSVRVKDGLETILLILRIIMLFDPLKVFLPPSLLLLVFGIVFGLYTAITEHAIWKSGLLLIFSGIMIFFFGLLADQVASVRREIKREE